MTPRLRKTISALTVASALAFASPTVAPAAQNHGAELLVGTWTVQVTSRNCKTHAPLGPPFLSLLTFNDEGTLTETTSNPRFYPAERGPGHGVWSSLGGYMYRASSVAFITSHGVLAEIQTIAQRIEIGSKGDSFVVPQATVMFKKPDGTVVASGCATAVADRFE